MGGVRPQSKANFANRGALITFGLMAFALILFALAPALPLAETDEPFSLVNLSRANNSNDGDARALVSASFTVSTSLPLPVCTYSSCPTRLTHAFPLFRLDHTGATESSGVLLPMHPCPA